MMTEETNKPDPVSRVYGCFGRPFETNKFIDELREGH